ncbi:hypothetical protein Tco_0009738 [Tanacetum coccineum]
MEESSFRQFKGDRHKDMLTMGRGTLLHIRVLTGKGLQVKLRSSISGHPNSSGIQTDDLDAFDSDCDDVPSAKAVLMANLSSYDSDVLLDVPFHDTNIENDMSYQSVQETQSVIEEMSSQVAKCNKLQQENLIVHETLTTDLERYKEQVIVDRNAKVADFEKQIHSLKLQLNATVESHKTLSTTVEYLKKESKRKKDKYLDEVIDLQKKNKALDNVVYKMGQSTQTMHMITKPQAFYDESHKTTLGYQNPFYLAQARWKVPALYDGHTIVKTHVVLSATDTKETLELAEESRLKMLTKQNDLSLKEKKVNIALVDYVALNKIYEHFAKHFVLQKQLSAEQAFWLPISQPVSVKLLVSSEPVLKKKIPCELPSIKAFEKDIKPFAQTLKEYFRLFEHDLNKELKEMKSVFTQMETKVANCSIYKKYFEIEKKELSLDNDRLLEHIICQDIMNTVMHANDHYDNVLPVNNNSLDNDNYALELLKHENDRLMELLISQGLVHIAVNSLAAINEYKSMEQSFVDEYEENLKLQTDKKNDMIKKLKAKNVSIAKLKDHIANLKGKNVVESVQNVHSLNVVTLKVYSLNRDAHVNYLKVTQEHIDTLRGIVEQARALKPLDNALDYACKYAKRIQELLVCVCASCPNSKHVSDKLVVVTPMNKTRKVRFVESNDTSKDKTQKQVQPQEKQTTNNSMSHSTGVSCSTEASRSKHRNNTKKDKISQTSSSNKKKNKVENKPRIAKSSLNNVNRISKIVCTENVKHSVLNANSKLVCATCYECMFVAIHDLCVRDYLVDMNARVKSKFVKSRSAKSKKKKLWKPAGTVYTNVGYSWKPTR